MAPMRHHGQVGERQLLLSFLPLGQSAGEMPIDDVASQCKSAKMLK